MRLQRVDRIHALEQQVSSLLNLLTVSSQDAVALKKEILELKTANSLAHDTNTKLMTEVSAAWNRAWLAEQSVAGAKLEAESKIRTISEAYAALKKSVALEEQVTASRFASLRRFASMQSRQISAFEAPAAEAPDAPASTLLPAPDVLPPPSPPRDASPSSAPAPTLLPAPDVLPPPSPPRDASPSSALPAPGVRIPDSEPPSFLVPCDIPTCALMVYNDGLAEDLCDHESHDYTVEHIRDWMAGTTDDFRAIVAPRSGHHMGDIFIEFGATHTATLVKDYLANEFTSPVSIQFVDPHALHDYWRRSGCC